MRLAQAMIDGVEEVQHEADKQRQEEEVVQKRIEKRKSSLITPFFNKKAKQ